MVNALLAGLVLLTSPSAAEQPCRRAEARIEQAIAAKAAALNGSEYCDFRLYSTLDLDGDGKDDAVVVFNVEGIGGGGNNVVSYLFVYLSSAPAGSAPFEAQVGARGKYLPASLHSGPNRQLVIETEKWRDRDAMCCPSGKGRLVYAIVGGKLRRVPGD
jgi:hypothetical protein